MIYRKQLYRHEMHNEISGDCHRTAIACLLDLEPWEVPHFLHLDVTQPGYDWQQGVSEFLASKELFCVSVFYYGSAALDEVLQGVGRHNPDALYLLGGVSPRGWDHTVICCGNSLLWDPHPSNGFVEGPLSNGYWEVTFLLPLSMKLEAKP